MWINFSSESKASPQRKVFPLLCSFGQGAVLPGNLRCLQMSPESVSNHLLVMLSTYSDSDLFLFRYLFGDQLSMWFVAKA